jgi:hypothetical protein
LDKCNIQPQNSIAILHLEYHLYLHLCFTRPEAYSLLFLIPLEELPQRLNLRKGRAALLKVHVVACSVEELLISGDSDQSAQTVICRRLTCANALAGGTKFLPIRVTILRVAGVST